MKKLKIYLETSVISYLDQPERGELFADTHKFWEKIKAGEYESFISPVVAEELERCSEPKRSTLLRHLRSISCTVLQDNIEMRGLATAYIEAKILRQKSFNDCQHIAYACVYNCDIIVSWNFEHIVNHRTISGVKGVIWLCT